MTTPPNILGLTLQRMIAGLRARLPLIFGTALLAWVSIRAILAECEGQPAVPLDDAYIHFQYASAFARLHPFQYTPGASPTPGATSLLWPLLLAPFEAIGFKGTSIIWVAWLFGYSCLALLALETTRLARGLVSEPAALSAGAMVLCFGGYAWCAGSGMEVLPFAWLMARSAREAAGWPARDTANRRLRLALCGWALAASWMRPEGVLLALLASVCLLRFPRGGSRAWAALPLLGPLLPSLLNYAFTGRATNTTVEVKWLPLSPYSVYLADTVINNLKVFFGTLLNGELWSRLFIPTGAAFVGWLALPALGYTMAERGKRWRGGIVLLLALGMLIPTTYDSFLWNRLRYLWPFAFAWFIALGALADLLGEGLAHFRSELKASRWLFAGGFAGAFAAQLSASIQDLAESADAIRRQQVSLGRWARDALPSGALIGVNDTGAIAYFSGKRTFDVVGLTTQGEARYWAAGAGSRFEHFERLAPAQRPTHFIVYENWLGISPFLGKALTERSVSASILGGTTMVACLADYSTLGSGAKPDAAMSRLLDELDVADLESESAHGYQLFWATQQDNVVVSQGERVDGGRTTRTLERFELELAPGKRLIARIGCEEAQRIQVHVGGKSLGTLAAEANDWQELVLDLPADLPAGRQLVELLAAEGKTFDSLHYWLVEPAAPAAAGSTSGQNGGTR